MGPSSHGGIEVAFAFCRPAVTRPLPSGSEGQHRPGKDQRGCTGKHDDLACQPGRIEAAASGERKGKGADHAPQTGGNVLRKR